jgi:hypothetical protein
MGGGRHGPGCGGLTRTELERALSATAMSDHEGTSSVGHSTAWDHTNTWRQTDPALDGPNAYPRSGPSDTPISPSTSGSPPPRSSVESPRRPSTSKYRDSIQVAVERAETASFIHSEPPTLVEPNFDESVLRSLCDLDVRLCLLPCDLGLKSAL